MNQEGMQCVEIYQFVPWLVAAGVRSEEEHIKQAWSSSAQILVSNTILQQKEPALLKEMADSRMGQEIYKMSLEHLAVQKGST